MNFKYFLTSFSNIFPRPGARSAAAELRPGGHGGVPAGAGVEVRGAAGGGVRARDQDQLRPAAGDQLHPAAAGDLQLPAQGEWRAEDGGPGSYQRWLLTNLSALL